jgi:hypothetical protein
MRRALLVVLLSALGFPCAALAAEPVILPHPTYHAGKHVGLQVVAPRRAKSCQIAFETRGRTVASHRVTLGGPTRMVLWRTSHTARGTWSAALSCRAGSLTSVRRATIVVGRRGRPRGQLVVHGSLHVTHGLIPEMPSRHDARVSLSSKDDTVINDCTGGNVAGCFNSCANSEEIHSTRTTGDGLGTAVQVDPTGAAHANSVAALASETQLIDSSLSEGYSLYREMWSDLNRCANLPSNLTPSERHSLYEQMSCHALYGFSRIGAGNTWDFEAWRKNVDWTSALSIGGSCGQGYGEVSKTTGADYLQGKLVKAYDTHASTLSVETWRVDASGGKSVRRNVATPNGYGCMAANGYAAPKWYPSGFLDEYAVAVQPDVTDVEACGPTKLSLIPIVTLAQGTAAPAGSWYSITLDGFQAGLDIGVSCRDSVDPTGFKTVSVTTDSTGHAAIGNACFSGDGPDHWVVANGVESNHVSWGAGGGGGGGGGGTTQPGQPINAYDNYGGGAAGHAMCRGNPGRPESTPGGTATQTFVVPQNVGSINHALVQIDPDSTVTAHASLYVNGGFAASADALASGDTNFAFPAVAVTAGETISLTISFTATYGKIITVYTVGTPGGTFSASNSCSDGAPSLSTSATRLRAVVSGSTP